MFKIKIDVATDEGNSRNEISDTDQTDETGSSSCTKLALSAS